MALIELATTDLKLDLNSDRWNLKPGECSIIKGRDVIVPGKFRVEGGRRPIVTTAHGSTALVNAWGVDIRASIARRFSDWYSTAKYTGTTSQLVSLFATSPFNSDMVGGTLARDPDDLGVFNDVQTTNIASIDTTTITDDTLNLSPQISGWTTEIHNFVINYSSVETMRGIFCTDGRRFWLFSQGSYTELIDLGSDDYLGDDWDMTKIADDRVLFVSPKHAARVIRAGFAPASTAATDETLAGCLPIERPIAIDLANITEDYANDFTGFTSGGEMSDGKFKALLRTISIDEQLESILIPVYDTSASPVTDYIELSGTNGNGSVSIETDQTMNASLTPPPQHQRWTNYQVWRTTNNTSDYYLEQEILHVGPLSGWTGSARQPLLSTTSKELSLPDDTVGGLSTLVANDFRYGFPPPMCRKVITLKGVTICAGAADDTVVLPVADAYAGYADTWDYTDATKTFTLAGADLSSIPYTFEAGDKFEVLEGSGSNITAGVYTIDSFSAAPDEVTVTTSAGSDEASRVIRAVVRRPVTLTWWPKIVSDENIWYSRTDTLSPESFRISPLQISRAGDRFRDMVQVGDNILVVMQNAVHLLFFGADGDLSSEAISNIGHGTPWDRSVAAIGNKRAVWATPDGAKIIKVYDDTAATGFRGEIEDLGRNKTRQWFADAFTNGDTVDVGVDGTNECVRWRRTNSSDTDYFEAIQWCWATGQWTVLDDDSGMAYVSSGATEAGDDGTYKLYSVDATGQIFEVNYRGTSHPYDSDTVQAVTDVSFIVAPTTINKGGAFNPKMLGEIVRFRSSNAAVDGVYRKITFADDDRIDFDTVTGLTSGDEFIIGANRFKIRFAAYKGKRHVSNKDLEGVYVFARPGDRHLNGAWGDPSTKQITANVYTDYSEDKITQPAAIATAVDIYNEDSTDKISEDRALGIEGGGTAVEIEIESIEARSDFSIEQVEANILEEPSAATDDATGV